MLKKVYNTCVPAFPPLPLPPCLPHLLSLVHSPSPPHPSASLLLGGTSSGSGALAGVFSQEKGDPSIMTVQLSYLMGRSRGRIPLERRSQEMTSSDPAPFPGSLGVPDSGTWRQGEGGGGKAWPARGPTYAQLVLECWSIHKTSWM